MTELEGQLAIFGFTIQSTFESTTRSFRILNFAPHRHYPHLDLAPTQLDEPFTDSSAQPRADLWQHSASVILQSQAVSNLPTLLRSIAPKFTHTSTISKRQDESILVRQRHCTSTAPNAVSPKKNPSLTNSRATNAYPTTPAAQSHPPTSRSSACSTTTSLRKKKSTS